jgi:ABC-type oligopeptide transport system substrate-binding subunit
MKIRLLTILVAFICSLLVACGGGGSSGSTNSSTGDTGTSNTALAGTTIDTISYGAASDFSSATTISSLFEKVKWYLNPKNFSFFKTAYASVGCSNSRIITGNSSETYSAYDVLANNDGDEVSVSSSI